MHPYPVFVFAMDPNWNADNGGGGRGADEHYETAAPEDIAQQLRESGAWDDFSDALGFMWATTRAVALDHHATLARALSIEIVSSFVWDKVDVVDEKDLTRWCAEGLIADAKKRGVTLDDAGVSGAWVAANAAARAIMSQAPPTFTAPARLGLGQWQRTEHEHLFVCKRGDIKVPIPAARSRSVIRAERGRHSAKPAESWEIIERLAFVTVGGPFRGVEFFAREQREGWGAYGRLDGELAPLRYAP